MLRKSRKKNKISTWSDNKQVKHISLLGQVYKVHMNSTFLSWSAILHLIDSNYSNFLFDYSIIINKKVIISKKKEKKLVLFMIIIIISL